MTDQMTMGKYDRVAAMTDKHTICLGPVPYLVMGLASEAGELAGKIKKVFRDQSGDFDYQQREVIAYELGDCLWYLTRLANVMGYDLETIATMNARKLESRYERGVIGGEGDHR